MSRAKKLTEGRAPFTREEIVYETRLAVLTMASLIANLGPRQGGWKLAADYVGAELDDYTRTSEGHGQLDLIPVEDHFLFTVVMDAFEYAYQLGNPSDYSFDVSERAYEVAGILTSFPVCDFDGEPSPLDRLNPQKLRQVLETFEARWALDNAENLTVPQLTLLADMGEAAVRTSLSAEGIKTISGKKGEKNQVPYPDALSWLLGRRHFVPSRPRAGYQDDLSDLISSLFSADSLTFEIALQKAISAKDTSEEALANAADLSSTWIEGLTDGCENPEIDVDGLRRLAIALEAPVPLFVGKAVTALLDRHCKPSVEQDHAPM